MSEEESVANYSWWMYWRYVWRNRVKAKFFNPYRAIPSVVTFVLVFIWKHNANKTPFTEMWVTVAVTVGVYLGLYWLNVLWSFLVLTPPKIYGEQIEVIQDGIGRLYESPIRSRAFLIVRSIYSSCRFIFPLCVRSREATAARTSHSAMP